MKLRKFIPAILFCFTAVPASAQDLHRRMEVMNMTDRLLTEFIETSSLKEAGSSGISDAAASRYRSLFTENAVVYDDINAVFAPEEKAMHYQLRNKTIDDYLADVKTDFPGGIRSQVISSAISYKGYSDHLIEVVIRKNISGTKSNGMMLENKDTLLLSIVILPDFSDIKIQKITMIGSHIRCMNDRDSDGVTDEADKCPDTFGPLMFQGCPDTDKDGIADHVDACPESAGSSMNRGCPVNEYSTAFNIAAGASLLFNNMKVVAPGLGDTGYDRLDAENANRGEVSYGGTNSSSVGLVVEVEYYFSKKKTLGLGTGINYNKFNTDILWENFTAQYRSVDSDGDVYRRIVTMQRALEKVESSYFSLPLLLKYRNTLNGRWGLYLEAGPSLLFFKSSTSAAVEADYEGIYQTNDEGASWSYAQHYVRSKTDVLMTDEKVAALQNGATPAVFFNKEFDAGYDFALGRNISSSQKIKNQTGIGANLRLGFSYYLAHNVAVTAGAGIVYGTIFQKGESNYMPVDRISSGYSSILAGSGNIRYYHYGIMAGIKVGLH